MHAPARSAAVAALAQSGVAPAALRAELARAGAILSRSGLGATLRDPALTPGESLALLATLERSAALTPTAAALLRLLTSSGHLRDLPAIEAALSALALRAGDHLLLVTSATPLSAAQVERLRSAVATRSGGTVSVETEVDPTLLGGLRLELDGQTLDHSFTTRLNELQAASLMPHGAR